MTKDPPTSEELGALGGLGEGVILVQKGRVRWLNPAAARFLEVDAVHSLGLPLIAVLRDHRLERVYLEGVETELETRGRILLARPVPGGLSLTDLSELRRTQEGARELLAVLSHELRTPATTIRATLEALRFEMPEAQRARFLSRAEGEADRLIRLLEDLTVDVKPPQLRRLSLCDAISRARALLQDTLTAHDVTLELEVPPLTVWADADKLLQVLINLVENAAIHGPDHATVLLKAAPDPENPSVARVVVRDQGPPLPPETVERLFEPHARGASVKARGTGLGLYIVRSIAGRWGGEAWGRPLEGNDGYGNEFGFSVPLK